MFEMLVEDWRFIIPFTIVCAYVLWKNLWIVLNVLNNSHYGKTKFVLVTGCDTGFGPIIAQNLTHHKCKVFAGCLTQEGVDQLEEDKNFDGYPFLMDVTKMEDVEKARSFIEEKLQPLDGKFHGFFHDLIDV